MRVYVSHHALERFRERGGVWAAQRTDAELEAWAEAAVAPFARLGGGHYPLRVPGVRLFAVLLDDTIVTITGDERKRAALQAPMRHQRKPGSTFNARGIRDARHARRRRKQEGYDA